MDIRVIPPEDLHQPTMDYPITRGEEGTLQLRASAVGRCSKLIADAIDGIVRPSSISVPGHIAATRGQLYEPWILEQVQAMGVEVEQRQPEGVLEGKLDQFGLSQDPLGVELKLTGHADALGRFEGNPVVVEVKATDTLPSQLRIYRLQLYVYMLLFERPVGLWASYRSDGRLILERTSQEALSDDWVGWWSRVAEQLARPAVQRTCDAEFECNCESSATTTGGVVDPKQLPQEWYLALDSYVNAARQIKELQKIQDEAREVLARHVPPGFKVQTPSASVAHVVSTRTNLDRNLVKALAPEVYEHASTTQEVRFVRVQAKEVSQ